MKMDVDAFEAKDYLQAIGEITVGFGNLEASAAHGLICLLRSQGRRDTADALQVIGARVFGGMDLRVKIDLLEVTYSATVIDARLQEGMADWHREAQNAAVRRNDFIHTGWLWPTRSSTEPPKRMRFTRPGKVKMGESNLAEELQEVKDEVTKLNQELLRLLGESGLMPRAFGPDEDTSYFGSPLHSPPNE
jgi:hypothetical protein